MIESTARVERITTDSSPRSGYHWEVPQKPVSVTLPFEMIDRLERLVVESFRSLTSRGSEIGGILLGRILAGSPSIVAIEDFELVACDYSRGPLYRLSDADMARFERAIELHAEGALRVVGYFRSHTRKGLSLDPEDVSFLDANLRDPQQIALLVRPYASKASTGGIFIRENGAMQTEASCHEFPFRASELTAAPTAHATPHAPPANEPVAPPPQPAPAPKPSLRAQIVPIASRREMASPPAGPPVTIAESAPGSMTMEPPEAARKPEPAARVEDKTPRKEEKTEKPEKPAAKPESKPSAEAKSAVETKPEPKKEKEKEAAKDSAKTAAPAPAIEAAEPVEAPARRGKGLLIAAVVLLAAIGAGGYFLYPGFHKAVPIPTASDAGQLNLRVEHSGMDLLVTWNRDAATIKSATHAVLSISDGEKHDNYDMDPGQLNNGSIVYSPLTKDVSFRLEVTGADPNKPVSDSVRMLNSRPSPMPEDAKNSKNAPTTSAATKNDSTASPATPTPAATDDAAPAENEKLASPSRPFDSASLGKRLRPATSSDMPDAPSVARVDAAPQASLPSSGAAPNLGSMAAPPPAPKAPAPAASPTPLPRPGGQITQAQLLVKRDPEYPKIAQQMGIRGTVELIATIGTDGKVKSVKVVSGHEMLVRAARDAVMQWVYKPTLLNGIPVENETHIKIDFSGAK